MRPVNVLDLRDTYEVGGPGKTILETYRAVDPQRFRLHLGVFLTSGERDDTPFITAARAAGLPVHIIRGFNQFDPRMIWRVARLIRRLEIDIVHSHEVKSDVITYLASLLHPVRIVTTLHGWIANSPRQRIYIALQRRIIDKFDRVIAVSGRIRDEVTAGGAAPGRLVLLHNAIVTERFRRTGRRGYLTELCGRPVATPVIASIGRISLEKGHADLVEALSKVAGQGYKVSAVIAGDGPARAGLLQQIQALGLEDSVYLPGYVANTQRILEDADLMVLPSHTEGLPNAALEALAMEVPVLATRVGGTPEVVRDGETGRLVPPRSPESLAGAIVEFLSDPAGWNRMAERGRTLVESEFNFQARTRRLETIYTELMASNGR